MSSFKNLFTLRSLRLRGDKSEFFLPQRRGVRSNLLIKNLFSLRPLRLRGENILNLAYA